MINSVKVMLENLQDAGGKLIAQYGIEAAMPKAQGGSSDTVYTEVVRQSKQFKTIEGFENKIILIQKHIHGIQDVREKEVLHWIFRGGKCTHGLLDIWDYYIHISNDCFLLSRSNWFRMFKTFKSAYSSVVCIWRENFYSLRWGGGCNPLTINLKTFPVHNV